MKIKDQIKARREQLGISVGELAKRVGVSGQSVRFWESGRSFPGKSKAPAVEAALSMTLDWTEGSRAAVNRPNMSGLIDPADLDLLIQICRLPPTVKDLISRLIRAQLVALDHGRAGFNDVEASAPIKAFKHSQGGPLKPAAGAARSGKQTAVPGKRSSPGRKAA